MSGMAGGTRLGGDGQVHGAWRLAPRERGAHGTYELRLPAKFNAAAAIHLYCNPIMSGC